MPRPCSGSPTPRACSRPTALRLGAAARAGGAHGPSVISARRARRRRARAFVASRDSNRSLRSRRQRVAVPRQPLRRQRRRSTAPAPSAPTPAGLPIAPFAPRTTLRARRSVEFTSAAPERAIVGGTYAVSASASSGLPVKYAVAGRKDVCKVSGSTVSFLHAGTCVDRGAAGGQRQVQGGARAAGGSRRPRPAGDRLQHDAARHRGRRRSGVQRRRRRQLRPAGRLRSERGKRRRLQGLWLAGLADGRRHVHGRGRAGRQRRLRARTPRAAVLRGRRGAADPQPPVDLLHHDGSCDGGRRWADLLRRGHGELGSRRQLRRGVEQRRRLHRQRRRRRVRRRGHVQRAGATGR